MLGREGMERVAEYATLNANYLLVRLAAAVSSWFSDAARQPELALTLRRETTEFHTNAMDFAKRLLDHGFHAPTTYFPLLVPECLLIEPTETETKEELDAFVAAMKVILEEARVNPELSQYFAPSSSGSAFRRCRSSTRAGFAWRPQKI
ncbi:hypothetical protein CCP3SC15_1530003 [Gammaproteobacteria bacterium]